MKNIILQHWNGPLGELEKLSSENIKAYAEKCEADYELVTGLPFRTGLSSQSQKLCMLDEKYDYIMLCTYHYCL